MTKARKWQKKRLRRPAFAIEKTAAHHPPPRACALSDVESVQQLAPYDEGLLERSRTQWQFGDWVSLAAVSRETLQHHPDRAKLALLVAAGHMQAGCVQTAKQFIQLAQKWGCSKRLISQILISGVHAGLGRAALALGQSQRALGHFTASASAIDPRGNNTPMAEAIALREGLRVGMLPHAAGLIGATKAVTPAHFTFKPPSIGIKSYAQNFEDVMLWRALGTVKNGFYIDVGAQDPVIHSVSKAFYDHGWRGIHVEPIAEYARALRLARPDEEVIEAILAGDATDHVYYSIPQTGLSTGTKEFAERHRLGGWKVHEVTVAATTLADVFESLGQRDVHWLKVDVEGMEEETLRGWRSHAARPWVLVVEATEPNSQTPTWHLWEHHLFARDYAFVYFDGLNRFYVHATHKELMQAFKTPPNVFDGFSKE